MHYLNYFNRTHSQLDGTWSSYRTFFQFEVLLILFNALHTAFFVRVIVRAQQFHVNWNNLAVFMYSQLIVHDVFWFLQRVQLLVSSHTDLDVWDNKYFVVCSFVRTTCTFSVFLTLTTAMAERCCATYFLKDYEKNVRPHISYGLLTLLVVFSLFCGVTFHFASKTLVHIASVVATNVVAVIGIAILEQTNKRFHRRLTAPSSVYSLTERFQISENIKVCHMIKHSVMSISVFNVICACCLIVDNFELPLSARNLTILLFDVSAFVYSFVVPHVTMCYCPQWKTEAWRLIREIFSWTPSKVSVPRTLHLRSTFGGDLSTTNDASEHFDNLQKFWDEAA